MIKPLIYNSDIKKIQNKAEKGSISLDEANLLRESTWSESQIQQACRKIFINKFGRQAKFIQIDNGGKMGIANRIKKTREGTHEGMKDVLLVGKHKKSGFAEFKKIGSPAEIEPKPAQHEIHDILVEWGFPAWFCNNTIYFEKVICKEFEEQNL